MPEEAPVISTQVYDRSFEALSLDGIEAESFAIRGRSFDNSNLFITIAVLSGCHAPPLLRRRAWHPRSEPECISQAASDS